jgi:hypothetical protein
MNPVDPLEDDATRPPIQAQPAATAARAVPRLLTRMPDPRLAASGSRKADDEEIDRTASGPGHRCRASDVRRPR